MHIWIYVHTYIHTYIYTHTCIYTYTRAHIHACVHTCYGTHEFNWWCLQLRFISQYLPCLIAFRICQFPTSTHLLICLVLYHIWNSSESLHHGSFFLNYQEKKVQNWFALLSPSPRNWEYVVKCCVHQLMEAVLFFMRCSYITCFKHTWIHLFQLVFIF